MDFGTARPAIRTSVLISPEFYELCRNHHIKFSEALRTGISLILAEKGVHEYNNNLNIIRKLNLMRESLEATSRELLDLKETKKL